MADRTKAQIEKYKRTQRRKPNIALRLLASHAARRHEAPSGPMVTGHYKPTQPGPSRGGPPQPTGWAAFKKKHGLA
jgi:hypothetical protein